MGAKVYLKGPRDYTFDKNTDDRLGAAFCVVLFIFDLNIAHLSHNLAVICSTQTVVCLKIILDFPPKSQVKQ